jgi:hypothetical protein
MLYTLIDTTVDVDENKHSIFMYVVEKFVLREPQSEMAQPLKQVTCIRKEADSNIAQNTTVLVSLCT